LHLVEESFWKRLWTCRVSDRLLMNEWGSRLKVTGRAVCPVTVGYIHQIVCASNKVDFMRHKWSIKSRLRRNLQPISHIEIQKSGQRFRRLYEAQMDGWTYVMSILRVRVCSAKNIRTSTQ
jgi:hypothetical protein